MEDIKTQINELYDQTLDKVSNVLKLLMYEKVLIDGVDFKLNQNNMYSEKDLEYTEQLYYIRSHITLIKLIVDNINTSDMEKNILEVKNILNGLNIVIDDKIDGNVLLNEIKNRIK